MKNLFRFRDWSLRAKIAALLAAAALLPLGLSAYIDVRQMQAQLLDSMESLLSARSDQIVQELDSTHLGYQRAVERIARFPDTTAYCAAAPNQRASLNSSMLGILSAYPASDAGIRGGALIDNTGHIAIATEKAAIGLDLSARPNVRDALQGTSGIFGVYISPSRTGEVPTIAYLMPVLGPDHRVSCVAVLLVHAASFWKAFKASNGLAGPGSFGVLFDQWGIRIGHTSGEDITYHPAGRLEPATVDRFVAERRFGARTRELLEDVRAFPEQFERARSASPDPAVFRGFAPFNQGWNYGVARRFKTVNWTLFYMVPEAGFTEQVVQATREKFLLALSIMVAAGLVGLAFAASILRPLRTLGRATAALARGDLATRVQDGRGDELGQLGASFNTMASQIQAQASALQKSHDELDRRVQERTAALTQTARRLETEIVERKRANRIIHESQRLLQSIIDNSTTVIYVKDLQGRYLLVNRRYSDLFHISSEAIVGKTDHELFPREVADAFRAMDQRVAAAAEAITEEEVAPHEDGPHTYVSVKCPLRDRHGKVYGVFGISTDITERKLSESRQQAQLERLRLLDQITCAIGERQDLQSIYQVVIRSLEERLPVDFSCVCRYDPLDNALVVIRVGDHSQAIGMELALGENSHIDIDENRLSRCVGGQLVREPDIATSEFPLLQRLARGGLRSLVMAPLQSESRVFGILVVARVQPDAFSSGDCEFLRQLSAHVALAAQQTQLYDALQRAYDDLRQTQQAVMQQERLRALGQMASGIAHDINNAISPVVLYTESLLEREPNLSERARGYLENIARAINDVAATVARMREFYRQQEPQLTVLPINLNQLVRQVADLTRARWSDMPQQRGIVITLAMELAADLPAVVGVESEIREMLINLVFNAVDAMPDGGTLTLRTRCADPQHSDSATSSPYACVEVVDTGVGMDEDTQRRCMEPFFTTKGERGTGLGLAMVYGVAQRHGARIDIESAKGSGTAIRLSFPTPVVTPAAPGGNAAAVAILPRLRILLVDDDPMLLKSLRDTLEIDGHAIVIANGGQAGIDAFRAAHGSAKAFDIVVTDLGMPYVDGRKVAGSIKEISMTTPVILLTGWGQRLLDDGDTPSHVDLVLSKPPRLHEVREALARCLRLSKKQVEYAGVSPDGGSHD